MSRGRGRGGFHPSYGHGFDGDRMDQLFFPGGPNSHSFRNDGSRQNFGARLGGPHLSRLEVQPNVEGSALADRVQRFQSDPRLASRPGRNLPDDAYHGGNPNMIPLNTQAANLRGKLMNQQSLTHFNSQHMSGIGKLSRQTPVEYANNQRQEAPPTDRRVFNRKLPIEMTNEPITNKCDPANPNLDSLVHNLLDSFDFDTPTTTKSCNLNKHGEEKEEGEQDDDDEELDFPSRIANFQRSFENVERFAVASNYQSAKLSVQVTNKVEGEHKLISEIKTEPRDQHQGSTLKQALEEIRQRENHAHQSSHHEQGSKKQVTNLPEAAPSSTSKSHRESAERRPPSTDSSRKRVADESRSVSIKSRLSRRRSPSSERLRHPPAINSPEWLRQVRIVEKDDSTNQKLRDKASRRLRRTRSRSRSRSSSLRRSRRLSRIVESPDRRRRSRSRSRRRSRSRSLRNRRSRSPRHRRSHSRCRSRSPSFSERKRHYSRSSDRGSRHWASGSGRSSRNSRSPARSRRTTPSDYTQRTVVERTVVVCQRSPSRSASLSDPRVSPPLKRLKEAQEQIQQQPSPVTNPPPASNENSLQFFTRGYVSATNQAIHNNQAQEASSQVSSTRYVLPPTQPVQPLIIPPYPFVNYFHRPQHPQHSFASHQLAVYQQQQQQQNFLHQHPPMNPFPIQPNGNLSVVPFQTSSTHPTTAAAPPSAHPTAPSTSSKPESAALTPDPDQRTRKTRDSLLEQQANLIHSILTLRLNQSDNEIKRKNSNGNDFDRFSSIILEKAKLEKELTVSAYALQKIIQKHTTQLKEDLSDVKKARSGYRYGYFDLGQHWCELCDVVVDKLSDYLSHLHSKEHEERLQSTGVPSTPWHKKRQVPEETDTRIINRVPIGGIQSLQPVKAWYCELCDVWMGDVHCAQLHMSSSEHNENHLKRSMERADANFTMAAKRQSALRRHAVLKREQEALKNQLKEADRLKLANEKRETAKRKEEELRVKRKQVEERFAQLVRREEMNKTLELEEPTQKAKEVDKPQPPEDINPSTSAKSIRLNIRTSLMTKVTEDSAVDKDVSGANSLESNTEETTNLLKPTGEDGLSTQEIIHHQPSTSEAMDTEENQQVTSELTNPTPPSAINLVECDVSTSSAVPDLNPVLHKDRAGASVSQSKSADTDINQNSTSCYVKSPVHLETLKEIPKQCLITGTAQGEAVGVATSSSDEPINRNCEMMETSVDDTEPAAVVAEQMAPVIQQDVSSTPSDLGCATEKFHQEPNVSSIPSTNDDPTEGMPDLTANNPTEIPYAQVGIPIDSVNHPISTETSVNQGNEPEKIASSIVQDPQSGSNLSSDKCAENLRDGNKDSVLKSEPQDESSELADCCVILEVDPKAAKVIEVIDLESSSDEGDSGQSNKKTTNPSTSTNSECTPSTSRVLQKAVDAGGEHDERSKSSAEVSVHLSDFIVLSETLEDNFTEPA